MTGFRQECNPYLLNGLLDDRLPEEEERALTDHLGVCESCQRALEGLAAKLPWWTNLRKFAPRQTSSIEGGTTGPPEGAAMNEVSLDFLAPTDDPRSLGRLGRYEVIGVVGRGGMGLVLKAFDSPLNRFVAVKVLAPELATSGSARQRFAREARAAAAVVHEHVVAIHAVDEAGGLPYLVMPYVAGRSLRERIERDGPLELKEILRIGMQTASGLSAAHAQGLVHRDVKPANILLENGVERVKLTDFGLARAVDDASLTQSGVVTGTPEYMSPEQARGESVDHRADLFSLGGVLYAMSTGHSPFRARTTVAVLRRVSEDRHRPIRTVNPDIPEWFEEVVDRLLEKDPAARFSTAAEVADLLGRHLARLQSPSLPPVEHPWVKRRSSGGPAVAAARASRRTARDRARGRPAPGSLEVGPVEVGGGRRPGRGRTWPPPRPSPTLISSRRSSTRISGNRSSTTRRSRHRGGPPSNWSGRAGRASDRDPPTR
ncbi:MAG: protein kinase [Singulisphaera sp.]